MNKSTSRRYVADTDFQIGDTTLGAMNHGRSRSRARPVGLSFVFLWFFVGGIAHFAATDIEMRIVPPYIPWPRDAVLISGVFELIGAIGLTYSPARRLAGIGLFALT